MIPFRSPMCFHHHDSALALASASLGPVAIIDNDPPYTWTTQVVAFRWKHCTSLKGNVEVVGIAASRDKDALALLPHRDL